MPERLANAFRTTVAAPGIGGASGDVSLPVAAAALLDLRNPAGTNVEYMRVTGSGASGASPWTVTRESEDALRFPRVAHPAGSVVTQVLSRDALYRSRGVGRSFGGALTARYYPLSPSSNSGVMKGANSAQAYRFAIGVDRLLERCAFYVEANQGVTGQKMVFTLHDDVDSSKPGRLIQYLGFYDSDTAVPTTGVKAITLASPPLIRAGRDYWLLMVPLTDKWTIRGGSGQAVMPWIPCDAGNPTIGHALRRNFSAGQFLADGSTAPADVAGTDTDWEPTDAGMCPMIRYAAVV